MEKIAILFSVYALVNIVFLLLSMTYDEKLKAMGVIWLVNLGHIVAIFGPPVCLFIFYYDIIKG